MGNLISFFGDTVNFELREERCYSNVYLCIIIIIVILKDFFLNDARRKSIKNKLLSTPLLL